MARVRWTPQAVEDVGEICAFIARHAPRTARRFGRKLFAAPERLERFPRAGGIVPEVRQDRIREIHVKRYRIIYRIVGDDDVVEILTVHHGSRLLDLTLVGLSRS